MSSSFENPFLWSRLARVADPLKIRVKSSTLAPKIIFHGKLMNAEWKGDPGLRHRSMEFAARIKWCVCTRVTVYTHLCGRDKHASRHGWEARGGRAPFTNASHRLNVRSPIEVRKIVAQARATPSGFSRCHADGKSSPFLPSTGEQPFKFSPWSTECTNELTKDKVWWHVLFRFWGRRYLELAVFRIFGHSISYEILWQSIEWREWMK